jgi:Na+/H+ antiporter NhaC
MKGNGSKSVFLSVLIALVFSAIYYIGRKIFSLNEFMKLSYKGIGAMVPVATIIIFAFTIGGVISDLKTGEYIASFFTDYLNEGFAPGLIFLLACVIAFSTGTSWGTFAILIPIALQIATGIDTSIPLCLGAVVSGSIMGDHCSPISDTTILTSMATASDHIDHVNSQLPYVLTNAAVSFILFVVLGFVL